MTLSKEQIEAIQARAEKATPGEWIYEDDDEGSSMGWVSQVREGLPPQKLFDVLGDSALQADTAEFVAHARTDIPALCQQALRAVELEAEKQELAMQALSLSGELEALQSDLAATRKALEQEREIVKWLERKPAEVHCDFKCGYGKHGNKDECHCGFADWEASRPSPQVKP